MAHIFDTTIRMEYQEFICEKVEIKKERIYCYFGVTTRRR